MLHCTYNAPLNISHCSVNMRLMIAEDLHVKPNQPTTLQRRQLVTCKHKGNALLLSFFDDHHRVGVCLVCVCASVVQLAR